MCSTSPCAGTSANGLDERAVPAQWPAELREWATAFDAMRDRLQDSFNRLTEFSWDIAHALRSPLNNRRGETEVALGRARAADQCVTVRGEGAADIVADPMLVRRAVSHLLGHALKDTPPGGTVRRWRRGRCTKARWRSVFPIRGPASRRSTCRGFSTGFPGRQEQVGLLARFIVRAVLSWGE